MRNLLNGIIGMIILLIANIIAITGLYFFGFAPWAIILYLTAFSSGVLYNNYYVKK